MYPDEERNLSESSIVVAWRWGGRRTAIGMHADVHRTVGPNDIATTARPAGNTREHVVGLSLDEPIENELATTLAFGVGALVRCVDRALVHALCNGSFRLRLAACRNHDPKDRERCNDERTYVLCRGGNRRTSHAHVGDRRKATFRA
jgi:hypothetical protein